MLEIIAKFKFIGIIVFFAGVFLLIKPVQASGYSIVRGSAWWAQQSSYLYFDCADDIIGDRLDVIYNLCGGVFFPPNPFTCGTGSYIFHFSSSPCSSLIHHVSVAPDGNLSGSAWNAIKGLVTFNGITTPDNYSFNSNCPSYPTLTCTSANDCTACYNENTQQVYGWARVEKDNTWINLNPATTSPVQIKSWNLASSTNPYYNINPGDFVGYATTSTGNLSFNCKSTNGGNSCASRNYKVYISNLQVGHLSAPNWGAADACSASALEANLSWDLKSGGSAFNSAWPAIDYQKAFEIIINTSNTTSSPLFDKAILGSATQYVVNTTDFPALNYNTNYYWWIRLQNEKLNWTPWYQFGATTEHNGIADTITDNMGTTYTSPDAKTFTTYQHEFPTPYFTWSPSPVLVGATTTVVSVGNNGQSCYANNCKYLWTVVGDPDALFYDSATGATSTTSTATSTEVIFKHATNTLLNLAVSDIVPYTCSTSTSLNVQYSLPVWREIKAQ